MIKNNFCVIDAPEDGGAYTDAGYIGVLQVLCVHRMASSDRSLLLMLMQGC